MVRLLLKIPRLTIFVLLMLFALSSNKHVLDHYLKPYKTHVTFEAEKNIDSEKDNSDKSEEDKKEKKDYYTFRVEFVFRNLVEQQLEFLHIESTKFFINTPLSPPPEFQFA